MPSNLHLGPDAETDRNGRRSTEDRESMAARSGEVGEMSAAGSARARAAGRRPRRSPVIDVASGFFVVPPRASAVVLASLRLSRLSP